MIGVEERELVGNTRGGGGSSMGMLEVASPPYLQACVNCTSRDSSCKPAS